MGSAGDRGLLRVDAQTIRARSLLAVELPRTLDGKAGAGEILDDRSNEVEGGNMHEQLPEWERLLRAAARLQGILPGATLVGGTAAAIDAGHRRSMDADHVIAGLSGRFDEVLAELESAAGWKTNRVKRPVAIYGSLDGILTTVRNQIRSAPLDTVEVMTGGQKIRVPTRAEILRVKAWLIVARNATRDFLDVVAIASKLSDSAVLAALAPLDRLYPQEGDPGAVRHQLMRQLAMPRPFDLESVHLAEYKELGPEWRNWATVAAECKRLSTLMANAVSTRRAGWKDVKQVPKR